MKYKLELTKSELEFLRAAVVLYNVTKMFVNKVDGHEYSKDETDISTKLEKLLKD